MPRIQPQPPESRDPNDINGHLKVKYEDVLAERQLQSFEPVWYWDKCFYDCCRDFTYGLLTLLTAPCIAGFWGCEFAFIAFTHIWCCTPIYLNWKFCLTDTIKRFMKIICHCCIAPYTESCSRIFKHFPKRKPREKIEEEGPIVAAEPEKKRVSFPEILVVGPIIRGREANMQRSVMRQLQLYLK